MAKKPTKKAESAPVEVLSDKEIVLNKYPDAECIAAQKEKIGVVGFVIFEDGENFKAVHSGIAKSEDEAWKLAAHAVL